jgi:hypothetical protein
MRRVQPVLAILSLLLAACPDAASAPCGDGFCRPGLVCSATLECVPAGAYCGDHHIDPGESCDDGTDNDDTRADACRSDCQPHRCGDGVLDSDEVPLCLRAGATDHLHIALDAPARADATRVLVHDAALPRSLHALATLDGSEHVALFTFDPGQPAGAPPAHALVDVGLAATTGTWWDPGTGAQLLVASPDDPEAERVAFEDGFWQPVEAIDFGVGGLVALQPLGTSLLVASSTRVALGSLVTSEVSDLSTWMPSTSFDVEGGSLRDARVGSLAGVTTVVALVETPGGRELRAYAVDGLGGGAALTGTWPLAPEDILLELQVGVSRSPGAGEVVVVLSDRIELRDAQLGLVRRDLLPKRLTWAHAARAAWNDDDVLVGGGVNGTWIARLVPQETADAPVLPAIERLDADATLGPTTHDGTLVDIDRDGWPELVRRRADALDLDRAGDGPWSSPVRQDGSARPLAVGDVDGDGVPDLIGYDADGAQLHRQAALPGRGLGPPTSYRLMNASALVARVVPCDTDGDGADELFVMLAEDDVTSLAVLRVHTPTGDEDDGIEVLWSHQGAVSGQITAADLEGDGACDLLFVEDTGQAHLYPGLPGRGTVGEVALGRIDGLDHGVIELRTQVVPGGDVLVMVSSDDLVAWAPSAQLTALAGAWSQHRFASVTTALPGVFTEDGRPAVLGVTDSGAYLWSEHDDDAPAILDGHTELALDGRVSAGDVNGDGLTDLVVNDGDDVHVLLARDHHAAPAQRFAHEVAYRPELGLLADLDGDGAADWVSVGQRFLRVRYGQPGVVAQRGAAARARPTSSAAPSAR